MHYSYDTWCVLQFIYDTVCVQMYTSHYKVDLTISNNIQIPHKQNLKYQGVIKSMSKLW